MGKRVLWLFLIVLAGWSLESCREEKGLSPTGTSATSSGLPELQMTVVPASELPPTTDTLDYAREFIEWNRETIGFDTTRADSLAEALLNSSYGITEMWFPDAESISEQPTRTLNLVTIRLTPGTQPLPGFVRGTLFDPYVAYWRDYKFTQNAAPQ